MVALPEEARFNNAKQSLSETSDVLLLIVTLEAIVYFPHNPPRIWRRLPDLVLLSPSMMLFYLETLQSDKLQDHLRLGGQTRPETRG